MSMFKPVGVLHVRVVFRNGSEQTVAVRFSKTATSAWTDLFSQVENERARDGLLFGPRSEHTRGFWIRLSEVVFMEPIGAHMFDAPQGDN